MKDQTLAVLQHLEKNGSITPLEAQYYLGVSRLSARIWELKHIFDVPIKTEHVTVPTRNGHATVAKYVLVEVEA